MVFSRILKPFIQQCGDFLHGKIAIINNCGGAGGFENIGVVFLMLFGGIWIWHQKRIAVKQTYFGDAAGSGATQHRIASGIKYADVINVLYSACDAVLCRAGASSIAEISLFDRYSFLVPYPYASEQHQKDNANILEAAGAATVIDNSDFTVEKITALLDEWLENPAEYHERATNCRYIARPASTQELLRLINECLVYGTRVSY
eukprot:TRINITY_DN16047_c0_g2_i2.p2 TRINITY_DN16047_c0_g2~~TRINITY_DN16047_c0_g2_i2.p2  ORF type:complete len:204 (+),score=37.73 TRINITY_DN16047_c0_g2_i2:260-871(+)